MWLRVGLVVALSPALLCLGERGFEVPARSATIAPAHAACGVSVFDVAPGIKDGIVHFVLGGKHIDGSAPDVEFVTPKTLYGLTIPSVKVGSLASDSPFDISVPYAAELADATGLKGVYVTGYTDRGGTRHACTIASGLPVAALPFLTSLPHDPRIEARAGMGDDPGVPPMPAVAFMNFAEHFDCPEPFRRAAVSGRTVPLEYPAVAREAGAVGQAIVAVALDAGGKATGFTIVRSAGNVALDTSALRAAHETAYEPEISACVPVPSTFLFRADFDSQ